jgi:hypothetical protein
MYLSQNKYRLLPKLLTTAPLHLLFKLSSDAVGFKDNDKSKRVSFTRAVAQTRIPLCGSLKRFLFIKLGEEEEQQCQLFEPEGRV